MKDQLDNYLISYKNYCSNPHIKKNIIKMINSIMQYGHIAPKITDDLFEIFKKFQNKNHKFHNNIKLKTSGSSNNISEQ